MRLGNHTCPICHKPSIPEFTPFCSKRCADIDLGKWFRGDYAVPLVENDDDEPDAADDDLPSP